MRKSGCPRCVKIDNEPRAIALLAFFSALRTLPHACHESLFCACDDESWSVRKLVCWDLFVLHHFTVPVIPIRGPMARTGGEDTPMEGHLCPLCKSMFAGHGSRTPLLAPCLHTFCLDCIQQIVSCHNPPLFLCPLCRTESSAEMSLFRTNTLELQQFYSKISGNSVREAEASPPQCGVCNVAASHFCLQCPDGGEYLCLNHVDDHARQKATRNHYPLELDDFRKDGFRVLFVVSSYFSFSVVSLLCHKHVMSLTNFCASCDMLICEKCQEQGESGLDSWWGNFKKI